MFLEVRARVCSVCMEILVELEALVILFLMLGLMKGWIWVMVGK